MVYAQEHILLRFNGHFGSLSTVVDKWSVGVRLGSASLPTPNDPAKLATIAGAAHTAAIAFHSSSAVMAGTNCFYDQCTAATIGPNGKYAPAGALTVFSPSTPTAGSGTASLPWNSASVISLRTAIPRGRGSNGRMYWPALALIVQSATGRVAGSNMQARINAAKTFLDALNVAGAAYTPGTRVLVASNVGLGVNAPVTSIRGDDRIDSIERRENDLPSAWSTATLS